MFNKSSESHLAGLGVFVRNGDLDCRESVQDIKLRIELVYAPIINQETQYFTFVRFSAV